MQESLASQDVAVFLETRSMAVVAALVLICFCLKFLSLGSWPLFVKGFRGLLGMGIMIST